MQRRSKDITPSLQEYLASKRAADDDVIDVEAGE
jgi:hypothetical protein